MPKKNYQQLLNDRFDDNLYHSLDFFAQHAKEYDDKIWDLILDKIKSQPYPVSTLEDLLGKVNYIPHNIKTQLLKEGNPKIVAQMIGNPAIFSDNFDSYFQEISTDKKYRYHLITNPLLPRHLAMQFIDQSLLAFQTPTCGYGEISMINSEIKRLLQYNKTLTSSDSLNLTEQLIDCFYNSNGAMHFDLLQTIAKHQPISNDIIKKVTEKLQRNSGYHNRYLLATLENNNMTVKLYDQVFRLLSPQAATKGVSNIFKYDTIQNSKIAFFLITQPHHRNLQRYGVQYIKLLSHNDIIKAYHLTQSQAVKTRLYQTINRSDEFINWKKDIQFTQLQKTNYKFQNTLMKTYIRQEKIRLMGNQVSL